MRNKQCLHPTPFGSCRKCEPCMERRLRSWVLRMQLEAMQYDSHRTTYITFTYDDAHLPDDNLAAKRNMQLFFKRLRQALPTERIRYVAGLEKGTQGTYRYHWHAILYGVRFSLQNERIIRAVWGNGFIDWKIAEPGNMAYVLKYCIKGGTFLVSRRPGIGANGIKAINDSIRKLSPEELNGLLIERYAKQFISRTLTKLRYGKYFYSLHRYIKERLLDITLERIDEEET